MMTIANASLSLFLLLSSVVVASGSALNSEADAYLSKLTTQDEFSGVVLIAKKGTVVFSKGYGMANREHGIANTTATVFRLGSVTKQLTAMCILILQESHKLDVTDLIPQYVEDCPEAWSAITIHHLLTHTSGIPSFTDFPDNIDFERLPTTVAATVQRFSNRALEFEPGTKMSYSDSGYVLLGYIIERITGTTFEAFINKRIFRPLGMTHSGYDHPADILPHRASGYSKRGTETINCIPFAMDTPHAAGALYSTVGDLLIWDQSLNSTRLVTRGTLKLMFTPFKGDYNSGWFQGRGNYCYGWFQSTSADRIQYEHPGEISGFATDVIRFPKERVYIVVLSNFEWADSQGIAEKLSRMFFNSEHSNLKPENR